MLEALRRGTASWIAKVFIGLLVLSFAVWGIADIFGGYGAQTVATVGDTEISAEELRSEFQREVRGLSNQLGRDLSTDDARSLRIDQQVLLRLIGDAALEEQAKSLGLGITAKAVVARIQREDIFKDQSGKFSQERLYRVLLANNLSEQEFFERQRRSLIMEQITGTVTGSGTVPKTLIDATNRFRNETRTLRYITVPFDKLGTIGEPTAENLREFYNTHKSEFRAPQYRKVGAIMVTPDVLMKTVEVPEEEIKASFEQNKDRFGKPERRAVLQMSFPDEAAAREAYEKLKGGADFMEVARERGLNEKDVDLGTVAKTALLDPAVADAVFALQEGEISEPIKGDLSTVIAKVTKIEPGVTKTLDDERENIRKMLAAQRAANTILDAYDKIEDERAAGATLEEIARKLNLEYVAVESIDAQGRDATGKKVEALAREPGVVRAIFSADVGVETDPEETLDRGFIWYEVLEIKPERQKEFDEVKDEVARKWREAEQRSLLNKEGQEIVDKLRGGESLAAVAERLGVEVKESEPLKRSTSGSELPNAAVQQAFALSQGDFGSASSQDGKARVIFKVVETKVPATAETGSGDSLAKAMPPEVGDDLIVQYVRALRANAGVNINQKVFQEAIGGRSAL